MNIKTLGLAVITVAIVASNILPAHAGRDGVPGRRIGGGSRMVETQVDKNHCPPSQCGFGDEDGTLNLNEIQDVTTTNTRSRRRNRLPK